MKGCVSTDVTRAAIAAMKKSGVRRLVAVSAYGAVEPKGFYGWMLSTMAPRLKADKTEMEATLRSSGLDWTSVQPPAGPQRQAGDGQGRGQGRSGAEGLPLDAACRGGSVHPR